MSAGENRAETYHVEVSGWDSSNCFFVERTSLDWNEDETKRVSLRSAVREGSVVFLRLLQTFGDGTGLPVACRVVKTIGKSGEGSVIAHLLQLHPHSPVDGNAPTAGTLALSIA